MTIEMNEKQVQWVKTTLAGVLILLAAVVRILPHPWNLTPIGAMALFSGSVFKERWLGFAFPLLALFAGDVVLGFHKLMLAVYLSFLISVATGIWIGENRGMLRISGGTLFGSIQFFLVTNFAVWAVLTTYPKSWTGLLACYLGGVSLFWNTLAGDALYAALLFGGYTLAERLMRKATGRGSSQANGNLVAG